MIRRSARLRWLLEPQPESVPARHKRGQPAPARAVLAMPSRSVFEPGRFVCDAQSAFYRVHGSTTSSGPVV